MMQNEKEFGPHIVNFFITIPKSFFPAHKLLYTNMYIYIYILMYIIYIKYIYENTYPS